MSRETKSESITVLLHAWKSEEGAAKEAAWVAVYDRLKNLAHHVLRGRRAMSNMGTTTVLHEAALELMDMDVDWKDSQHFFSAEARCMRFVLVDEARKRMSQKRGSGQVSNELSEDAPDPNAHQPEELLAVHQALDRLERVDARQAELVELRYFAGMSVEESAQVLGVSKPTVVRMWRSARVWLYGQLQS